MSNAGSYNHFRIQQQRRMGILGNGLGVARPTYVGPFDAVYNHVDVAVSMRRLFSIYTGPCLTARRSDGTVQDIPFGNDGWIDEAAAVAFMDGQDAVVTCWYDQAQNSGDALGIAGYDLPYLGYAGVLTKNGFGKPALNIGTTNTNLSCTPNTSPTGAADRTLASVYEPSNTNTTGSICGWGSPDGHSLEFVLVIVDNNSDPYLLGNYADLGSGFLPDGLTKASATGLQNGVPTTERNGVQGASYPVGFNTTPDTPFYVGSVPGQFSTILSKVSECISFDKYIAGVSGSMAADYGIS